MNGIAILDLDWKIVDASGTVLQQGTENTLLRGANNVNLGDYHPKRGERQKLIVDVHREIEEPEKSRLNRHEFSVTRGFASLPALGLANLIHPEHFPELLKPLQPDNLKIVAGHKIEDDCDG